jgi:GAF domain-containing protein
LNQLRSAAEISRVAGSILNVQAQLEKVVQLVYERFGLFYAGVFLREENGEEAVLSAQAGEELVEAPASRRLDLSGNSIVSRAILLRRSRLYLDTAPQPGIVLEPFFEKTRTALALPLNHGPDTIGALIVYSAQSRAFDEDDITILQGIADSLAVALVNAQLYTQGQSSLEEIRALNRQYFIQAWREAASSLQPLSHSFESELPASPDEKTSPISVPLTLRQQSIGELTLETSAQSLSPDEMAFIEAVTTQAALALENARLLEETQRRASREQLVAEIARAVRATSDVETILRSSVQRLGQALHASEAVIHLSLREEAEPGNGSHSAGR